MKLTIPKSLLSSALGALSSVCGKSLPILAYAKVVIEPNSTRLITTDLDCFYEKTLSLEKQPEELGEFLLPASRVKEFLSEIRADEVTLESEGQKLVLSATDGQQRFSTDKVEDFPKVPSAEERRIASADFAPLKHVSWAAIKNSVNRPMLEAVFLEMEGDGLVAVATDGRKLGKTLIKAEMFGKFEPVAIPSKHVNLVASLGPCEFYEAERFLVFKTPSTRLFLAKSTYGVPNWRRDVASVTYAGSVTVIRSELATAVALCHQNRGQDTGIAIEFHPTEGEMRVSCLNELTNDSYETTLACRIKGVCSPAALGTEHLLPFFDLPDESALKIEFSDGTPMRWNAGDTDFWFCQRRIKA